MTEDGARDEVAREGEAPAAAIPRPFHFDVDSAGDDFVRVRCRGCGKGTRGLAPADLQGIVKWAEAHVCEQP